MEVKAGESINIAILGAGIMAKGMIRNLQKHHNINLFLYNRTREVLHSIAQERDTICFTPKDAALKSMIVISCVSDDYASKEVWFGEEGAAKGLTPGTFAIESSTVSVNYMTDWIQRLLELGVTPVDCPLTGSKIGAENGELSAFFGGEMDTLNSLRPILSLFCKKIFRIGGTGDGCKFKLVHNLLGGTILTAYAEALHLAGQLHVSEELTNDILSQTGWGSLVGSSKGSQMVKGDYTDVHGSLDILSKDLKYGIEAGPVSSDTVFYSAAKQFLKSQEKGLGRLDMAAIRELYRLED